MGTLYQITADMEAVENLLEGLVDENGDPREPTPEEEETLKGWFLVTAEEFKNKFDSYCRFIKNLKISAKNADDERKNYKEELDRLAKRAKASENKAKTMNGILRFCMERLGLQKFKSDFFSAGIQNTQLQIHTLVGDKLESVPEEFLKPREIDTTAVKQAIKDGILEVLENQKNPLNNGKIAIKKTGEIIKGLWAAQGTALVIR